MSDVYVDNGKTVIMCMKAVNNGPQMMYNVYRKDMKKYHDVLKTINGPHSSGSTPTA